MNVTSRDVAGLAGVSQPTVSRALRGDPRVSASTQRRVIEAAARLGYVPSDAGRALSSGRTQRIGLLVTDLDNPFYANLIAPLHRALAERGQQLVLHTESGDLEGAADRLIAGGLDGVILATSTIDGETPARLRQRGIPLVYLNRTSSNVDADATVLDPGPGMTAAVDRAIELGHTRIGAILGPADASTARDRESALRVALARHGLALSPAFVRRAAFETTAGEAAAMELLALKPAPTVLFCANDVVAYGALNAAARHGIAVPAAVSVVGFDDLATSAWPIIQLATIGFDLTGTADSAAELIVRRVSDPETPIRHIGVSTRFIDRATLGLPRIS